MLNDSERFDTKFRVGKGVTAYLNFFNAKLGGGGGVRNEEGKTLFATDEKSVGFLHMQEKNY